jgi:hypothetical protein
MKRARASRSGVGLRDSPTGSFSANLQARRHEIDNLPSRPRWRRGLVRPKNGAAEPSVHVSRSYARYETQGLLQIVYTVLFPQDRMSFADAGLLEARLVLDLREPRP